MDAWAQAVEAMREALGGTENWCFQAPCSQCDADVDKMLRAALPHLMAAVVEKVDLRQLRADLDMAMGDEVQGAASLLAALTDSAGRVK